MRFVFFIVLLARSSIYARDVDDTVALVVYLDDALKRTLQLNQRPRHKAPDADEMRSFTQQIALQIKSFLHPTDGAVSDKVRTTVRARSLLFGTWTPTDPPCHAFRPPFWPTL
eukprot:GEMP01065796.1.p2 GENE.GEMP01065796.1~~GEMP01065796.1.p2  ORF type:complete len:113 (+),score=23.42 GEMP01065796.1:121-459(+)